MHLGIDLGTSNSAIVGNNRGELRHFKTPDGTDVLPSAIMIDRRGGMLVGKRAYDQSAFSPESVAQGFKRLMGTSSSIQFPKLVRPTIRVRCMPRQKDIKITAVMRDLGSHRSH
jgi:molecular chaperone DnaK